MARSCNGGGIVDAAIIHHKGFISVFACLLVGVLGESKPNSVNTSDTTVNSVELSSSNYFNWLGNFDYRNNGSIESVTKTTEKVNKSTCHTLLYDAQMFNVTTYHNDTETSTNISYSYDNSTPVGYNQSCISEKNKKVNAIDNEMNANVLVTARTQEEVKSFKNLVDVLPINSSSQLRDILKINHSKNDYSIILWKNKELVKIFVKSSAKGLKPYYFRLNQNNNNSYLLNHLMKSLNNVQRKFCDVNVEKRSNFRNYSTKIFPSKNPLKRLKKRSIEEKLEIKDAELTSNVTDKNTSKIECFQKLNRKSRSNHRMDESSSQVYDFYDAEIDEGLVPNSIDENDNEKETNSRGSRKNSKSRKKKKRKRSKSKKAARNIRTPPASEMDNDIVFEATPESNQPEDVVMYDESNVQKPLVMTKRDQSENVNNSDILMLIKSFVDNELLPESNNAVPEKKVVVGHDVADPFKFENPHDDHATSPVTSPLHFNIYFYNNRDHSDSAKIKNSPFGKSTVSIEARAVIEAKDSKRNNIEDEFNEDNSARNTEYSNQRVSNEPMVVKSGCNLKTIVLSVMIALIVAAILLILGYALFKHLKKKVAECQPEVSECSTCNR